MKSNEKIDSLANEFIDSINKFASVDLTGGEAIYAASNIILNILLQTSDDLDHVSRQIKWVNDYLLNNVMNYTNQKISEIDNIFKNIEKPSN